MIERRSDGRWSERYIDVFEEGLAGDAENAGRGFDEVIAGEAGMIAAEGIGEGERFGELASAHEKAGTINFPVVHDFFHLLRRVTVVLQRQVVVSCLLKCCDCTRRGRQGQLHINCATGGIRGSRAEG